MFTIKVANLSVQVKNRFNLIREKCTDYIVENTNAPDLIMEASPEAIQYSIDWKQKYDHEMISEAEGEYDAAPYGIYGQLARFNAFWLHSVVVEMDGVGYAFSALPGYGKSTHAKLWMKAFGNRVRIINGDNPIIREENGRFYAYGTPFCGKEGYHVNVGVPLAGVCFLNRAEENSMSRMDPALACARMLRDNYCIKEDMLEPHIELYGRFVERVPAYILRCNMDVSAAHVAYEGMKAQDC